MFKSNVQKVYSQKFMKIKIRFDDDLPLDMHNVVLLAKFVFNKYHKHYYYKAFLEKCSD